MIGRRRPRETEALIRETEQVKQRLQVLSERLDEFVQAIRGEIDKRHEDDKGQA